MKTKGRSLRSLKNFVGLLALLAAQGAAAGRLTAQTDSAPAPAPDTEAHQALVHDRPAVVPFGPGERLEYNVSLGRVHVGNGSFEVAGIDTVRGHLTYRLEMRLRGGAGFVKVDDSMTSWLDVASLVSRRFDQDQKEFRYQRHRTLEFYPEEKRYYQPDKDEHGSIATDKPLDDISFLYYARTLPLEVGHTYTLDRYFDAAGNPVTLEVLRRDTVSVPAGRFATIVVRPIIQTRGMFGKGGQAEVYFTDDARRLVVEVRSSVPVIGHLNMYLSRFVLGDPLSSAPAAPDSAR